MKSFSYLFLVKSQFIFLLYLSSLFTFGQSLATEIIWVTDAPKNEVTDENKVIDIDTSTFNIIKATLNPKYTFTKLHMPVNRGFNLIQSYCVYT